VAPFLRKIAALSNPDINLMHIIRWCNLRLKNFCARCQM
jgi:hypothetical protein